MSPPSVPCRAICSPACKIALLKALTLKIESKKEKYPWCERQRRCTTTKRMLEIPHRPSLQVQFIAALIAVLIYKSFGKQTRMQKWRDTPPLKTWPTDKLEKLLSTFVQFTQTYLVATHYAIN
jgi:hypothetical protein